MNSNCTSCEFESKCFYPYKPTDCCNKRKFRSRREVKGCPTHPFQKTAGCRICGGQGFHFAGVIDANTKILLEARAES